MFVLKKSKDKPPITTNPTTSPTTGASSSISTTNTISSVTSSSNNDKRLSLTSANLARLFLSKPTPSQVKNTPSPASASQIPKINIESSLNMYSNPTSPNNQKSSLIVNASPTSNSSFLKSKSKQKRRKHKKRIKNMRKKFHYPEDTSQLIRYSDIDFGYGSDYEFSFSDLPDEIIVQIFQYIPVVYLAKNFSVVSKKFAMMWIRGVHTVQVLGPLRKLNEDAFVKFVRKFSFLEVLDLCNSGSSEDFQITDKGLLQLAHKYIYSNADYLAMPPAIDPISGNFDLNFDYEQHLDSIDESASVYSSTAFDTQSYNGEDDDNTEAIGEEDDDVTSTASTDVSSFTNTKFNKQITATPFNVLYNQRSFGFTPKRNPNSREPNYGLQTLHTLNVQGCHYITDNGVKYLTYISQNLTHLNLRGCTKVNDSAMSYISQFSQLNFLDMTGCVNVTDLGVKHLSQSACKTKLKYLDLTFCHQVTDEGVKYLSEMTELEDLTLQCCRHITAKGLSQLVNSCQNIRVLNLTGCHLLEISGVRSGSLPKLEKLSMMGCKLTSDNCLKVISDWTSNLKELVLSFSDMITDAGIARVITNSKNLSHLNLKKCSNITDKSLECISKHLNNVIEYINLTGVRGFTNDGFRYLENCTSLKELVIQRCIHVNNEGISHLLHCPSLEILDISENTLITGDEILKLCKKGQLKQLKIEKCKISKEVINTISQTVLVTQ